MKSIHKIAAVAALFFAVPASAENLDNDDVLALLSAGLGEEAVIAKIETDDGNYITDVQTLLALREQGVPSSVIAAMVKKSKQLPQLSDNSPDPLAPHFAGVYIMDTWTGEPRMVKIDPTASNQTKTGGLFGYALTGGIASASVKAVIPGKAARHSAPDTTPEFYLYLDSSAGNSPGAFSSGFGPSLQSPNELSLIRLKQKKENREARIGSLNIGGAKTGVMDKDQLPFNYEIVSPGVYRITVEEPLEPGQYGFVFAIAGGVGPGINGAGGGARIFAFGIDAP